jgi:alkylation response protein AidB-like acyl-CoA dehydrogenase
MSVTLHNLKTSAKGGMFLLNESDPRGVFTAEDLTVEDHLIGKTAEEFMRSAVLPHTARIEEGDHVLMDELMRKAGDLGLLGADVPDIYGGLGLPLTTSALIAEKLNPQQSFALTHEAHSVIATLPLMFFGTHEQKQKYLPRLASGEWIGSFALSEADSGSDALALKTRATLSADGSRYLLNGEKMWITNSAFASLFTVFAKVDEEQITAFLIERDYPGVSFGKEEHKLGMHGTSTRRLLLENVSVPVENALEVGKGHYAALCALNLGRFKLEAGAVGGLKAVLATSAAYAMQRKAFGKRLADFGLIKQKLAQMCARTFSLESMIYRLAAAMDGEFAPIDPKSATARDDYHRAAEEYSIECNIVKVLGSESYSAMADESIQIHGGYGYTEEFSPARTWRDQRLLRIGEGANEVVRLAIINTLLRRAKQGRFALKDAGAEATRALSRAEAPDAPFFDHPLDAERAASRSLKQLAIFLLYQATERYGPELSEMQEVSASIADIICSAYAVESVWLRCSKMSPANTRRYEAAILAAQTACRFHSEQAVSAARYALDCIPSIDEIVDWRDEPFTGLANMLANLQRWEGNPAQIGRDLANRAIEAGGWPV